MADYDDSGDELQRLLSANPVGVDLSNVNLSDFNLGDIASGFSGDIGNLGITSDFLSQISTDPELFRAFQAEFPEDAAIVGALIGGSNELVGPNPADSGDTSVNAAETKKLGRQAGTDPEQDPSLKAKGVPVGNPNDPMGIKKLADISGNKTSLLDKFKKGIADATGLGEDTIGELGKYGLLAGIAKMAYDDAQRAREEARGWSAPGGYSKQAVRSPGGGVSFKKSGKAMGGGIGSLDMARGGRALPPRYLNGHSDGMADKVPANIDGRRPAALSDGEFVIPADVVSHLGNGNSNAGAKRLYKMMDDIRAARTGNHKQGKQINPDKFMPR
jgi:hypothetical protein